MRLLPAVPDPMPQRTPDRAACRWFCLFLFVPLYQKRAEKETPPGRFGIPAAFVLCVL